VTRPGSTGVRDHAAGTVGCLRTPVDVADGGRAGAVPARLDKPVRALSLGEE